MAARPFLHACRLAVEHVRDALFSLWPIGQTILDTRGTPIGATFRIWVVQKIFRVNGGAYWPVHPTSTVTCPRFVRVGVGSAPGRSPGCYIQGLNGIVIGDHSLVGPNVGLISANHNPAAFDEHVETPPIVIGNHCWIGMNAVVLPGVVLGDHTIVAANSVVTESFPDGRVVVGGVPAKVLRSREDGELSSGSSAEGAGAEPYIGYHRMKGRSAEEMFRRLHVYDPHNIPKDTLNREGKGQ